MAERVSVRAIWMVVGAIAVVLFAVMGTLHVVSALAHEEATFTHRFAAGDVTTLEVHADNGSLTRLVRLVEGHWWVRSFNEGAHQRV